MSMECCIDRTKFGQSWLVNCPPVSVHVTHRRSTAKRKCDGHKPNTTPTPINMFFLGGRQGLGQPGSPNVFPILLDSLNHVRPILVGHDGRDGRALIDRAWTFLAYQRLRSTHPELDVQPHVYAMPHRSAKFGKTHMRPSGMPLQNDVRMTTQPNATNARQENNLCFS